MWQIQEENNYKSLKKMFGNRSLQEHWHRFYKSPAVVKSIIPQYIASFGVLMIVVEFAF